MRDTCLWLIVMYARRAEAACFASAVYIAEVRHRVKSQDTGFDAVINHGHFDQVFGGGC